MLRTGVLSRLGEHTDLNDVIRPALGLRATPPNSPRPLRSCPPRASIPGMSALPIGGRQAPLAPSFQRHNVIPHPFPSQSLTTTAPPVFERQTDGLVCSRHFFICIDSIKIDGHELGLGQSRFEGKGLEREKKKEKKRSAKKERKLELGRIWAPIRVPIPK